MQLDRTTSAAIRVVAIIVAIFSTTVLGACGAGESGAGDPQPCETLVNDEQASFRVERTGTLLDEPSDGGRRIADVPPGEYAWSVRCNPADHDLDTYLDPDQDTYLKIQVGTHTGWLGSDDWDCASESEADGSRIHVLKTGALLDKPGERGRPIADVPAGEYRPSRMCHDRFDAVYMQVKVDGRTGWISPEGWDFAPHTATS